MCFAPQRRALFRHLNFQKWSEPGVFVHFDLEMCFSPQRRALFRHLNFQKWSEPLVFLTFWLGNVLRATTACTFSTSQLPKVVRRWGVFNILTWKCASRHNGVQFFISHLASWLRTRRFSEPTFPPSGAASMFLVFQALPFLHFMPFFQTFSCVFLQFFKSFPNGFINLPWVFPSLPFIFSSILMVFSTFSPIFLHFCNLRHSFLGITRHPLANRFAPNHNGRCFPLSFGP